MGIMVERLIGLIARAVGISVFVVLLMTLFVSVLIRYFNILPGTMQGVEESSRFLFIWLSFLGAILAMETDGHIRLDLVLRLLPVVPRRVLETIAVVLVLVFLATITWYGVDLAISASYRSSALSVPFTYVYLAVPICAGCMAIQVAIRSFRRWRSGGIDKLDELSGLGRSINLPPRQP